MLLCIFIDVLVHSQQIRVGQVNYGLMLDHRLRRWSNINLLSAQYIVFTWSKNYIKFLLGVLIFSLSAYRVLLSTIRKGVSATL